MCLPVINAGGEDIPPDAPLDQYALFSDGDNRGYGSTHVSPLDD